MRWADIPVDQFEAARDKAEGLAVVPIGAVEPHGPHLPLGTDFFMAQGIADRASAVEFAVVLPPVSFTWTGPSTHLPGAINIGYSALLPWLENLCDEIYRNGFRKIVFVNEHGGNGTVLSALLGETENKQKPYTVYVARLSVARIGETTRKVKESKTYGHACEVETSMALEIFEEKVDVQRAVDANHRFEPSDPRDLKGMQTAVDWVADHSEITRGDPALATKEKGKQLVDASIKNLAELFRKIKLDEETPKLMKGKYVGN